MSHYRTILDCRALTCEQVIKNTLNPSWKQFEITSQKLCNSNADRKIKVDAPAIAIVSPVHFLNSSSGDLL